MSSDATVLPRVRFILALRSRPFALLWVGETFSALGNGAYATALAWQVLLLTGSAVAMGIVVTAQLVPRLVFLLLGGVTADRVSRRLVMFWSDIGRAFAVLLITGLGWMHLLQLWHLVALALFFGCVRGFFDPAYQAIVPQLVEKEALPSANALNGLSQQLNQLLGPLLGVGLVVLAGPVGAFAFDGLTFLGSSICLLLVRIPVTALPGRKAEEKIFQNQDATTRPPHWRAFGIVRDVREGLGYITGSPWLWVSIVVASVSNLGVVGPIGVALPKLVHDVYGAGVWLLGALSIANAVGAIVATALIGQISPLHRRGLVAYLAMVLTGFAFTLLGVPLPRGLAPVVAVCACTVMGIGLGAYDIIWTTVMQELVPGDKLGRVSSFDLLGSYCLLPVSYALTGLIADALGPSLVFIAGGLITLLMGCLALTLRDIRQLN
jgi:MFS family permease